MKRGHQLTDERHARRSPNEHDLVNLGRLELRVDQSIASSSPLGGGGQPIRRCFVVEQDAERGELGGQLGDARSGGQSRRTARDELGVVEPLRRPQHTDNAQPLAADPGKLRGQGAVEPARLVHIVVPTVRQHDQVGDRGLLSQGQHRILLIRGYHHRVLVEPQLCSGDAGQVHVPHSLN